MAPAGTEGLRMAGREADGGIVGNRISAVHRATVLLCHETLQAPARPNRDPLRCASDDDFGRLMNG